MRCVKSDNLPLGLVAGDTGTIWALYETQLPAYEVTFSSPNGGDFDALMYEEELVKSAVSQSVDSGTAKLSPVPA